MKIFVYILILFFSMFDSALADKDTIYFSEFNPVWSEVDTQSRTIIHLYFFWSKKCPHCVKAQPFVEKLDKELPWIKLHSYELSQNPENILVLEQLSNMLGVTQISIPAFSFCKDILLGFSDVENTGKYLRDRLVFCRDDTSKKNNPSDQVSQTNGTQTPSPMALPLIGILNTDKYSLPVFTLIIASLDSLNPCAFFVLLFLLSLLVHAHHRRQMFIIGMIFIFFSALIYFLFMAAWLNVFILFGKINAITTAAGTIAVVIAIINIKDYFWFKKGISLSIPESAKPGLFSRMRRILNTDNFYSMVAATVALAIFANSYELLCTAGFPMVYTRHLTLQSLSTQEYYSYLLLYCVIYIVPLTIIVTIFTYTLGARKLNENEGRFLKLVSGFMMLGLGFILLMAPDMLNNPLIAFGLITFATMMGLLLQHYIKDRKI